MEDDRYLTIEAECGAVYKEKSSKFLAYAYPVRSEEEIRDILNSLKKQYYDATHHCYAWRLGAHGENFRSNDDGEPSGTAGKPILGQLLSHGVTYCLIAVVRYFGGTKLGVSGLITAYKEAARAALEAGNIVERTTDISIAIRFPYVVMNDVMRIVKEMEPNICEQRFDNVCSMTLSIRAGKAESLRGKLQKVSGITIEENE
ncbi:MAG: YigZ family protein [Alistipes sp.]|nr:YigZ family protein [Alistipes sp.]